jgi:hypothetical protein
MVIEGLGFSLANPQLLAYPASPLSIDRRIINMKSRWFVGMLAVAAIVAVTQNAPGHEKLPSVPGGADTSEVAADTPVTFTGEKTSWHGFDRYDFLMDGATFALKPIKALPDEKNGVNGQVPGQLRCVVVVPKESAPGKPWSWRGYYFDHEPQAEIELLKRGFHIGFILSDAGKQWDAWYTFLTEEHGLAKKPAFVGMSRGGRNAFTWATANPTKVSSIYVDNPAISRESLMKLGELAQNDVPLLHVCGSLDPILGNHTLATESIYQQLGGRISVMIKDGAGHHPHSLRDPTVIADFIMSSLQPSRGDAPAIDRARLHHFGTGARHLEQFVMSDLLDFARDRHDPRIARMHAIDVGEDLAIVRLQRRGERDRGQIRAAPA